MFLRDQGLWNLQQIIYTIPIREQNKGTDKIAEYQGAVKREREDRIDIHDVALRLVEIQDKEVMDEEEKPDGEEWL